MVHVAGWRVGGGNIETMGRRKSRVGKMEIYDVLGNVTFPTFSFLSVLHANISRTARYPEHCMWDEIYQLFVVASKMSRNSLV